MVILLVGITHNPAGIFVLNGNNGSELFKFFCLLLHFNFFFFSWTLKINRRQRIRTKSLIPCKNPLQRQPNRPKRNLFPSHLLQRNLYQIWMKQLNNLLNFKAPLFGKGHNSDGCEGREYGGMSHFILMRTMHRHVKSQ